MVNMETAINSSKSMIETRPATVLEIGNYCEHKKNQIDLDVSIISQSMGVIRLFVLLNRSAPYFSCESKSYNPFAYSRSDL